MAKLSCYDRDNTLVICSDDQWDNHIVDEHPEMCGWEAYVETTIKKPYRIYQPPRKPKEKALYKPFILPEPFHMQYLRVVIKYEKRKFRKNPRGYVITAFPCTTVRKGDILIWEEKI